MNAPTSIDFTVGSRRLAAVERDLATWSFSLEQALLPSNELFPPRSGTDGLRVLSAPLGLLPAIRARFPEHLIGGRQTYRRHYIDMSGTYEDYLSRFSGKTRSTLRRKQRKLAKELGTAYAISEYRTRAEIEAFLAAALPLSAKTYQARLLDAGLPETEASRTAMLQAAEADRMRCYLLHSSDGPVAYLSLPIVGETLIYAHLGYDPGWSKLSPGTVLQMEALERLFAEQRFRYFDFTEGEGAHKAMFGSDSVECCSFVLLEPTMANRALLSARSGFDDVVELSKSLAEKSGALGRFRRLLRT
jgi:CelD/BcsL family acetyltransferase involved in cellulose biosynthesis